MIDHDVMPVIAIAGGSVMLLVLVCIGLLRGRRRDHRDRPRMTSFHMTAIDPRIAEQGRAAWEQPRRPSPRGPDIDVDIEIVIEQQDIECVPARSREPAGYTSLPNIDPPREQPRRYARGSAPGIVTPVGAPRLSARPHGWELHNPSVTARMRAFRRTP